MNKLEATNRFHPVGQGLFYSGRLSTDVGRGRDFNFVFDCGSNSQKIIDREVELYCKGKSEIEMLFISHLHFDHVSGLKTLFDNVRVKSVFLPYLTPVERIRLAVDSLEEHEWYYNFLENPSGFLGEYVEEIIYLVGSEDSDYDDYYGDDDDGHPWNREGYFQENIFKNNLKKCSPEFVDEIGKTDPGLKMQDKGKVKFAYHFGSLIALDLWEFKLFCYPVNKTKLDKFAKEIKDLGIAVADLRGVLCDRKERAKLAKAYKLLNSNINVSSLTVHHGCIVRPRYVDDIYFSQSSYNWLLDYFPIYFSHGKYLRKLISKAEIRPFLGTLLLGDIKLEDSQKCNLFFDHYNFRLMNTFFVQLSHHGARNGWHSDLIEKVNVPCSYICSSGRYSNDHPSRDVMLDIINARRCFVHVNEKKKDGFRQGIFIELKR